MRHFLLKNCMVILHKCQLIFPAFSTNPRAVAAEKAHCPLPRSGCSFSARNTPGVTASNFLNTRINCASLE